MSEGDQTEDQSEVTVGGSQQLLADATADVPDDFLCPISYEVMQDPVKIVETGVTYERRAIEVWLFQKNQRTCPATQRVIKSLALEPNTELKRRIEAWLAKHGSYANLLELENQVQENLFPEVDNTAVAVHSALEQLGSFNDEEKLKGLAALCTHTSWPNLPSTLLSTGSYLELVQVVNTGEPDAQAQALRCLRYVAKADGGVSMLCETGLLDSGVQMLSAGTTPANVKAQAVALVLALSSNFHNRVRLLYCGAVKALVGLLDRDTNDKGTCEKAAKLLSRLADVDVHDFRVQLMAAKGMDVIFDLLSSDSTRCQLAALSMLQKMASKEQYRLELLEAGCAQLPIRLLRSDSPQVQEKAAALLSIFAQAGPSREQLALKVGIEPFAALLLSDNETSKRHATNMLFQLIMSETSTDILETMLGSNTENQGLRGLVRSSSSVSKQNAQDKVCSIIISQGSLQVLVSLVSQPDEESQQKAIMLLARLSAVKKVDVNKFIEAGAVPQLVRMLASKVPHCMEHAAITIGHLATTNAVKKMFVDAGAVRPLMQMAKMDGRTQQVADTVLRKLLGLSVYWHMLKNKHSISSSSQSMPVVN